MSAPLPPQIEGYLETVQTILPLLAARREATETARRVDDEALAGMREAGVFRLLTPRRYGGEEASLRAQVLTCALAAQACPASAWLQMVCGAHTWVLGSFPPACQQEVFGSDPDVLVAGTLSAQGEYRRRGGGWALSGRWQFCSGVDHAPWLLVGARRADGEDLDGPASIHAVLPTTDAVIDDTWHTLGMRGTGSKDIVLDAAMVPEHRIMPTGRLFAGASPHALQHPTGLYVAPVLPSLATQLGGTILGIAEAARAAYVERTRVRTDVYAGGAKAEQPALQRRLAEASGEIRAAELLVTRNCDALDAIAARRQPAEIAQRAELRWQASFAVELCRRAVERLFVGAGAHAAYDTSPLQKLYRDIATATRHAAVDFDGAAQVYGRVALGLEPGSPLL